MQKKVLAALAATTTDNIMRMLLEVVAKPIGAAHDHFVASGEPLMASILNATEAVLLTYRFEYHDTIKFGFLRGFACDRLAEALLAALDAELAKAEELQPGVVNKAVEIDPVMLSAIVNRIADTASAQVALRQQAAVDALKSSGWFRVAGVEDEQVDAGVALLMDFIRGYAESKVSTMMSLFSTVVAQILTVAVQHREVIAAHVASKIATGEDGPASEEYVAVRQMVTDQIDHHYKTVYSYVFKYVSGFFNVIDSSNQEASPAV